MEIRRFVTTERSSQIVACGGLVFLAGQIARDCPTGSIAEQTRNVLSRIDALLASAGSDKGRLLNATIWLEDVGDFTEMNDVWSAWLPPGAAPARAVLEGRMVYPDFRVEIAVVAATS